MSVRESFTLKTGVENFAGGLIAYGPDGHSIDLAPLAVEGAVITVTSELQASVLRGMDFLKQVRTPEEHEENPDDDLEEGAVLSTVESEEVEKALNRDPDEEAHQRAVKEAEEAAKSSSKSSQSSQGASSGAKAGNPSGGADKSSEGGED